MPTRPLQLLLLLVGVALAFVLPFEKPGISKRRKKHGHAEAAVPAVGGVWSDERTLDRYLAAAVQQVPEATGAAFLEEPSVRVSSVETVAGILREDYDAVFRRMGAKDDAGVAALSKAFAGQVVAIYEPGAGKNIIHVLPANAVRASQAAGDESLMSDEVLRLLLVRMAVIAQDRQLFPAWKKALDTAENNDALSAAGAILQGHAQYVTERVAIYWKLPLDFPKLVTLLTAPPPPGTPPHIRSDVKFAIVEGHAFIKAVARKRGSKGGRGGIAKLFNEPPKNRNPIFDPGKFLGRKKRITTSDLPGQVAKEFTGLTAGDGWTAASEPFEKAAADALLEPVPASHTAAVRAAFKSGTAWIARRAGDGACTTVTLIEMSNEGMAEAFVNISKGAAKQRGAEIEDGAGRDSGLPGYVTKVTLDEEGRKRAQSAQWTFEGRFVLGLTTTDPAADRDAQDDALEAAAEVIAKVQKTRKNRRKK